MIVTPDGDTLEPAVSLLGEQKDKSESLLGFDEKNQRIRKNNSWSKCSNSIIVNKIKRSKK